MNRIALSALSLSILAATACGGAPAAPAVPAPASPAAAPPAAPSLGTLGKTLDQASKEELKAAVKALKGWELKSFSESGDEGTVMIITVLAMTESPHGEAYPDGKKYQRMVLTVYRGKDKEQIDFREKAAAQTMAKGRRGETLATVELQGRPQAEAETIWVELFGAR